MNNDDVMNATYEYGPFGELLSSTGTMAASNPFHFSTKYCDSETGLLYYGYRYYSPGLGRWISRDPLEERGGLNLYCFCGNDGVNRWDALGKKWTITRSGDSSAEACATSGDDSFNDLAINLQLDTSDYRKWAHTTDSVPELCKRYKIPNTIYIDIGVLDRVIDHFEFFGSIPIFTQWKNKIELNELSWKTVGYNVVHSEGIVGSIIKNYLMDNSLYGYVYIGHGAKSNFGGIIGTFGDNEGLLPGRYTNYGIAFMRLHACYSGDKGVRIKKSSFFRNLWDSNVSRRGFFIGYEGAVDSFNEENRIIVIGGTNQ